MSLVPCLLLASGEPDAWTLAPVGARVAGMGGAFIGLADDIEAVYYNPAGLGNLASSGLTATYQAPSLDTSRSFLAGNVQWKNPEMPAGAGFGWLRLSSPDIEITQEVEDGVLGHDDLSNNLFLLSAGASPYEHVALGFAVKYFRYSFHGFRQSGFGFDGGAHARWKPWSFGLALTDIGGTVLEGDSLEPGAPEARDLVPARLRPGIGLSMDRPLDWPVRVALALDGLIKLQGAQEARLFFGTEIWGFGDRAAFRTGFEEQIGPAFGFGARWRFLQLDYAYRLNTDLPDEHRFGTTFRF